MRSRNRNILPVRRAKPVNEIITTQKEKPVMLSVRQVAMKGILPERTLRQLIAQKKLPILRSGRTQYINYGKLLEALTIRTANYGSAVYNDRF
jgi:hypothetical protein